MHIDRMLIGYASGDHDLESQNVSLTAAGCIRIFEDRVSGPNDKRHQRKRMFDEAGDGDVIIVHQLRRLAQSTVGLLETLQTIKANGMRLRSLTEPWSGPMLESDPNTIEVISGIV